MRNAALNKNNIDYRLTPQNKPINVLAVEDDILSMNFLEAQIHQLGHNMYAASNGKKALAVLELHKNDIDVVLMDREMPVMDGLTAVKEMKANPRLRNIPIVMVTGADSKEELKEGLDAGVFYYLTKPVQEDILRSVLSAAVREAQLVKTLSNELRQHEKSFGLLQSAEFHFKTLTEAENLAAFMAGCFPDPERVLPGLGELMINAIEHGNLSVGYDLKTDLIDQDCWREEVNKRQSQPENKDKYAIATLNRKPEGIYVIIKDEGNGFDWKKYLHLDPERAADNHGRGIAQSKANCFDSLKYNDAGNKVVASVKHSAPITAQKT